MDKVFLVDIESLVGASDVSVIEGVQEDSFGSRYTKCFSVHLGSMGGSCEKRIVFCNKDEMDLFGHTLFAGKVSGENKGFCFELLADGRTKCLSETLHCVDESIEVSGVDVGSSKKIELAFCYDGSYGCSSKGGGGTTASKAWVGEACLYRI